MKMDLVKQVAQLVGDLGRGIAREYSAGGVHQLILNPRCGF